LRIPQFFQGGGKFERTSFEGFVRKLQRRLGAFLLGNFLSCDIDAKNGAVFSLQRMPVGNPYALCVTPVRSLAIDLYARDRLSGRQNRLDKRFDLVRYLRDGISH
jgi:hypothetical protein